jgi:hypothetical protein
MTYSYIDSHFKQFYQLPNLVLITQLFIILKFFASRQNHICICADLHMHTHVPAHTRRGREKGKAWGGGDRERNPTKKRKWPLSLSFRISHFGNARYSLSPSS